MSINVNDIVPARSVPVRPAGVADSLLAVIETGSGGVVRVPIGSLPPSAAVQAEIAALVAGQQTDSIYADTKPDLDAVTGTYVGQGAFVLNGAEAGQYRWSGSGWEFLRGDMLATKADNSVTARVSGAHAVLATEAGQVLLAAVGLGEVRIPGVSLSQGAEVAVRDDVDLRGVALSLLTGAGPAAGYVHAMGDLVNLSVPEAPPATVPLMRTSHAQERDLIYGAAHNQWIYPLYASMNGRRYHTSIGQGTLSPLVYGDVQVSERAQFSRWNQIALGRQEAVRAGAHTDDHNAPCVLLDPRPDAKYPVIVFGADHSDQVSRLRAWLSTSDGCAGLSAPMVVDVTAGITTTGGMSYAQAFRDPYDPDMVYVLSRQGNTNSAVWWIHRSRDGFRTAQAARLFAGNDLYLLARPSRDGLHQHFVIQQHPKNGTDQRILYLQYRFSDGSLRAPGSAVAVADVWSADAFRPFESPGAAVLYTPGAGRNKRLFDAAETDDGLIEVVAVDFDMADYVGTAVHIALQGGGTPSVTTIGPAGYPLELSNSNAYFAGLTVSGKGAVVMAVWDRAGPDTGELAAWSLAGGAWTKGSVLASSSGFTQKIGRPVVLTDFAWDGARITWSLQPSLTYLRGRYDSYSDFYFDLHEVSL